MVSFKLFIATAAGLASVVPGVMSAINYISNLAVVYSDTPTGAPANRVREFNNGNPDINAGFGGSYVWLVPEYTTDRDIATASYNFVSQEQPNTNRSDLAKGTGGKYRYLIPVRDVRENMKFVDSVLLRSGSAVNATVMRQQGWTDMTADINQGRGGDHLYLVWKTQALS